MPRVGSITVVILGLLLSACGERVQTTGERSIYAIAQTGTATELRAELSKGFNVNRQDENGMTLLHHAVLGNNAEAIEMLTEDFGANAAVRDNQGRTPRELAIAERKPAAARALQSAE